VKSVLNDIINAINLTNPIPDPEFWTDEDAISENVGDDLTWPVVAQIGLSLGTLIVGVLARNPLMAVIGVITSLGWAIGGPDDPIGQGTFSFDHTILENPAALNFNLRIAGDDNVWYLSGGATVNS